MQKYPPELLSISFRGNAQEQFCLTSQGHAYYWCRYEGVNSSSVTSSHCSHLHILQKPENKKINAVIMRPPSIFPKLLTKYTPELTRYGATWGVFCGFKLWFILCLSHCSDVNWDSRAPGVNKLWVAWLGLCWLVKCPESRSGGFHLKLSGFLNANSSNQNSKHHIDSFTR